MISNMLSQDMNNIQKIVVDYTNFGIVKIYYKDETYEKISSYDEFNGEELNFIYENKLLEYKYDNIARLKEVKLRRGLKKGN